MAQSPTCLSQFSAKLLKFMAHMFCFWVYLL